MCEPIPYLDEDVKTIETSLGQNIITGTADLEDESTTSTPAETAEEIGTNVGYCDIFHFVYLRLFIFQNYRSNTYAICRSLT